MKHQSLQSVMTGFFVSIIFLFPFSPLDAQDIISSQWPTEEQLPVKEIPRIFQDSDGYIWYGTNGGGLCRDDGYTVRVFRSDFKTPELIKNNTVTCITEDAEKRIWFGTKRGMYILDKKNYQITPLEDEEIKTWHINAVTATSDGSVWVSSDFVIFRYNSRQERIGTYHVEWDGYPKITESFYEDPATATLWITQLQGGLFHFDFEKDCFIPAPWPFREYPTCIIKDREHDYYWLGTAGKGIIRFQPKEKDPDKMYVPQPETVADTNHLQNAISVLVQDKAKKYLWALTLDNLYAYRITAEGTLSEVDTSDYLSGEKKILSSMLCDRLGNIWVAGYSPYSFVLSFSDKHFERNKMAFMKESLKFPASISQMIYDEGYFWLWFRRGGILVYHPNTNQIVYSTLERRKIAFPLKKSRSSKGVYCVWRNQIILHLKHEEDAISESELLNLSPQMSEHEIIRTIHEDTSGNIWIGTSANLYRYSLKTQVVEKVWENTGKINDVVSSADGSVYFVAESTGFHSLSPTKERTTFKMDDNCTALIVAPNQNVWIGTQRGDIYRYDPGNGAFGSMADECGLNGDLIIQVETDISGNIWILNEKKITIFNPKKHIFDIIHHSNPAISMSSFSCLYKDERGNMYVGGTNGYFIAPLQAFSEESGVRDPEIRLTAIKVNGNNRMFDYENDVIKLQPSERDMELSLSTFDPLNKGRIRYAYRSLKDNSHLIYLPIGQNNINLSNLQKGHHKIEIMATDKNGNWGNNKMMVHIYCSPKWYETWVAYLCYVCVVLLISLYLIFTYIKKQKEKNRIQMEEQVTQMKYRFFTNVSHELRTPLTLIITPLESIIKKITDERIKKQLETVEKNARDLLMMVNQLLDFRKIEMQRETLSLNNGDMKEFLNSIYENFRPTAIEKKLSFEYQCEMKSFYLFFDAGKIQKIVNNLLSNAFKFSKEKGKVVMKLSVKEKDGRSYAVISVTDTGIGIPKHELDKIFERFHQVKLHEMTSGSGIGLHLVKEYANMHEGDVYVQSVLNEGTCFSVHIPVDLNKAKANTEDVEDMEEDTGEPEDSKKKILIVEDNLDFRSYLKEELSHYYTVYEASNGVEGESEVLDKYPDVVISDLMMPKMDGIELCHRIKNNIKVSHTPVILLTASMSHENERRGYEEGADAYITKPFNLDILLTRIENQLEQRRERQEIFRKDIEIVPKDITISNLDKSLIEKALRLIENNISNPDYSIEEMSSDMAMSRSNLFRKIRSITGMPPTEFIKNMRLKKAAKLLSEEQMGVAEVAYTVGFSSSSHFTKSFKKMFGISPTQYSQK